MSGPQTALMRQRNASQHGMLSQISSNLQHWPYAAGDQVDPASDVSAACQQPRPQRPLFQFCKREWNSRIHRWIICIWHIGSRVFPETVKVWQSGAAFVPSKKWCGEFTCIGRCGHLKVQKWRAANMNWIATDFRHTLALNSITQAS